MARGPENETNETSMNENQSTSAAAFKAMRADALGSDTKPRSVAIGLFYRGLFWLHFDPM